MISFKSRCETIRQAEKITLAAKSIYPHISESKSRRAINHFQAKYYPLDICYKFAKLGLRNSTKIDNLRYRSGMGIDLFRNIIDMLKNKKIGNCYEDAVLAQIIGKINGVKNIFPAKIYFNKNSSGYQLQLDHVVSIITDKPFQGYKTDFKNKDAVVLDPWLGITEFVGDYIRRIKTDFAELFPNVPDFKYSFKNLAATTDNIDEFNKKRKEIFKPKFSFMLYSDELLSEENAQILKKEFPELIFKKQIFDK